MSRDGYSLPEIAAELGIAVETARASLKAALAEASGRAGLSTEQLRAQVSARYDDSRRRLVEIARTAEDPGTIIAAERAMALVEGQRSKLYGLNRLEKDEAFSAFLDSLVKRRREERGVDTTVELLHSEEVKVHKDMKEGRMLSADRPDGGGEGEPDD
jgi:hypothetical protein